MGTSRRRLREMEFEHALTGVLEDNYDLHVRVEGDPLERRRDSFAWLAFDYTYLTENEDTTKVVVSVADAPLSCSFRVDLEDPDDIARACEDCEDLALGLSQRLGRDPLDDFLDWDPFGPGLREGD